MNMSGNLIFLIVAFMILAYFLIRNLVNTVFNADKLKLDKIRDDQITKVSVSQEEKDAKELEQMRGLIGTITGPFGDIFSQNMSSKRIYDLTRKLRFTEWDKYFDAYTFTTFIWVLRIVGVLVIILLMKALSFLAFIIGGLLIVMPEFLLHNTYKNKQDVLTSGFPEMINIISGYLSANMLFTEAVVHALPHIAPDWQPIMEKFVTKANISSVDEALEWLAYAVDIAPIREFVSIVKLNLELGNSVKDSFAEQADKVRDMLEIINEKKIASRKSMATMVQAPLLLCIIAAFALPTVGSIIDIL